MPSTTNKHDLAELPTNAVLAPPPTPRIYLEAGQTTWRAWCMINWIVGHMDASPVLLGSWKYKKERLLCCLLLHTSFWQIFHRRKWVECCSQLL